MVSARLTAGSELDFAPYTFVGNQGRAEGLSIDLLEAVGRHAGLSFEHRQAPWPELRERFDKGDLDLLPIVAISEKRARKMDFSVPYLVAYDAIFTRPGSSIQSEDDLRGKTLIVMKNDYAHEFYAANGVPRELITAPTLYDAMKLLSGGAGDAIVTSEVPGLAALRKFQIHNVAKVDHTINAYRREYAFAVRKGSGDIVDRLNHGLAAVKTSGEYQQIAERWFESADPEREHLRARLFYLSLALATVVVVLLGIAAGAWILRREVAAKTRSLALHERQWRQIFDSISDLVFVKDRSSRLVWVNRSFQNYWGMSLDQLKGLFDAPFNDSSYTKKYMEDDSYVVRTGQTLDIPREPVTRHDGVVRQFHTVKSPILAPDGSVELIVGVSRDITEKQEQEQIIEEQRAKMISSAKLSSLGEMAAGMAHEINNPLAIISGNAQILRRMASDNEVDPKTVIEYALKIEATTRRISNIVRGLLSFARETSRDLPEAVAPALLLEDSAEFCRERFKRCGITLKLEQMETPQVLCRPGQISQVLLNLFNNAFDAVQTSPKKEIVVSIRPVDSWVEIRVEDSGPGVPPELTDRIFVPFFTTKEVGRGTGLGLSISRGIIESHHGRLFLDRNSARTCFVIRLPGFEAESPGPVKTVASAANSPKA